MFYSGSLHFLDKTAQKRIGTHLIKVLSRLLLLKPLINQLFEGLLVGLLLFGCFKAKVCTNVVYDLSLDFLVLI